jgi:O-6-methylguanine DNA methyltransferase
MKEQLKSAILPKLPIVGHLKITTRDDQSLYSIKVVNKGSRQKLDPYFQECFEKINSFLLGESKEIDLKLDFSSLTPFQVKVLKAMKKIPYGKVASYKDLAVKLNSKAYQAIGSACGRNPFLLIYPCHRVVGSDDLGGFAHGLEMKKKLLALECN